MIGGGIVINLQRQYPICGGVETYEWEVIPNLKYCENETLEMSSQTSFEDFPIAIRLEELNLNYNYALFQHDDLNGKGFHHFITNCTEMTIVIVPEMRDFALYRLYWKQTWISIIEVECNEH